MPTVTIRPGAADEETIPKTVKWTRTREIGSMRRARITVPRADAEAVTLNEKEDDIQLGSVDTLRLVDVETGGPTWTLVCYSYEWLANNTAPFAGGTLKEDQDDALVKDLVGDVSDWSEGTINNIASNNLSFVFNHALRHEGLRIIERNVPGEILFRDTGTVDYTDRIGSDKSGSITLSAGTGNIEDEIDITKRGRELDGTHIRVLGAHEGEAQKFANLVPSVDSGTYDNRVNYSTARWSDGDTKDWDVWSNKDVTDQDTIEEEAASLGKEISERLVEAKVTVPDSVSAGIGDTVQVQKSDADLNRSMRIHRRKTTAQGGTRTHDLLLSTRTIVRSDDRADLRDIQRFNKGFQGSSVIVQGGGSRQPVDSANNAQVPFFYPAVEFENKAELLVRGLPYRAYSSGAASGGQHTHDVNVTHPSHNHDVSIGTKTSTATSAAENQNQIIRMYSTGVTDTASAGDLNVVSVGAIVSPAGSFSGAKATVSVFNVTGSSESYDWDLNNTDTSTTLRSESNVTIADLSLRTENYDLTSSEVSAGDTLEFDLTSGTIGTDSGVGAPLGYMGLFSFSDGEHDHDVSIGTETSTSELGTTSTETSTADGTHTHAADPGITEFGATTPTGVDVVINNSTVATDIGSGTFETEIDITDELSQGNWNDIELTSDDLGHIQATVTIQSYQQIGKQ